MITVLKHRRGSVDADADSNSFEGTEEKHKKWRRRTRGRIFLLFLPATTIALPLPSLIEHATYVTTQVTDLPGA